MRALKTIQEEMANQKVEMKTMEESIKQAISNKIDEKFCELNIKTNKLEEKIEKQEVSIEHIERQLRKRNIMVFGMDETERSYSDLVNKVLKILNETMEIPCQNIEIEDVHRKGRKREKLRPIIVTLTTMGRKIDILKNKYKLLNSGLYIKEDFTPKVLEVRKELQEELKKQREMGKNVVLRYDKIITLKGTNEQTLLNSLEDKIEYKRGNNYKNMKSNKRNLSESPEIRKENGSSYRPGNAPVSKKNRTNNISSYMIQQGHSGDPETASSRIE